MDDKGRLWSWSGRIMKALKITLVLPLVILILLAGCSKKNGPGNDLPDHKWTILGYFDGNNSEDQTPGGHSYVIQDLQEMEQVGSTDQVQVVVMLGSFKTEGNCRYYDVEYHPDEPPDVISSEVLVDLGKKDMSDPAILREFISYGAGNYPAERYMLIISDHSRGWKGLCSDEVNGDGDWMSLPELSFALSGFYFDIVWLYAPSTATAEMAYQIKDRGEYMIASQFNSYPDSIMGSAQWLAQLTGNPDINTRDFARDDVTEGIYNTAQSISPVKYVHSVLIHLDKMEQLAGDLADLGRILVDSAGANWSEVWDAWKAARNYDEQDSTIVDLRQFAREIEARASNPIIRAHADTLRATVNRVVLAQFVYIDHDLIGGPSIHLPWNHDDFDSLNYVQLDLAATNWHSFVSTFIKAFSSDFAGTLDIRSSPTGARVYLNGVYTGYETNAIISGLLPGSYVLKLTKDGYLDCVRSGFKIEPRVVTYWWTRLNPAP
jgi:hypothetical protein